MNKPCKSDDCDGSHCRKCGGHFFDFYSTAKICSSCEQAEEYYQQNQETPLGEQIDGGNDEFQD